MSNIFKKILSFIMVVIVFVSCPLCVNASEHGGGGGTNHNPDFITDAGTINIQDDGVVMYYIEYILAQIGAVIVDHDITKVMANDQTMKEYIAKGKFDANKKTVEFPKETVVYVKQQLEQYAKEHEPYYMVNTMTLDDMVSAGLKNKVIFDTVSNLIDESKSNIIAFAVERGGSKMFFADIGSDFRNISAVKQGNNQSYVYFYDNETWALNYIDVYRHSVGNEALGYNDFVETADFIFDNDDDFGVRYIYQVIPFNHNGVFTYEISNYDNLYLITKEKRRIRVFNTYGDFQNFTLGKRKVYYTENYYNYVPEDLSVSIDDLEKSVDDLQKVIDELLKQIQDNTDEKEIEDLLRQILEEIRNGQGTGGGGTGGGDVNVDIDLSTTNGLLSKILAKVTQIFDKLSESVEGVSDSVHTKIQDTLDEMLVQIKKLKHWTMADTAVNAADAVADWLDFLKGIFDDMENGAGNAVAAISSGMDGATGLLKTKFPFCIPWDVAFLVTFLAHEPETPVFKLPIHLESIGIDEYIEVDMSDFSGISTISRTILMLIYCYGLLNLTMKIIPMAKEGS